MGRGARRTSGDCKGDQRGHGAGILRLDFDRAEEGLEKISWDAFFEKFDEEDLAFLYQDKTADGKTSRFHKFVDRNSADEGDEEDAEDEDEDEDEEEEDEEGEKELSGEEDIDDAEEDEG